MEESEYSRNESSITFPAMKTGTTHVNEEKEKVSPVNSCSNAEPGCSKKTQNEDLINLISTLINTRLTEFRSEMITMINKNGDQPVSLGEPLIMKISRHMPVRRKRQSRRYPL